MLWLHFMFLHECPDWKGLGQEVEEVVRKLWLRFEVTWGPGRRGWGCQNSRELLPRTTLLSRMSTSSGAPYCAPALSRNSSQCGPFSVAVKLLESCRAFKSISAIHVCSERHCLRLHCWNYRKVSWNLRVRLHLLRHLRTVSCIFFPSMFFIDVDGEGGLCRSTQLWPSLSPKPYPYELPCADGTVPVPPHCLLPSSGCPWLVTSSSAYMPSHPGLYQQ